MTDAERADAAIELARIALSGYEEVAQCFVNLAEEVKGLFTVLGVDAPTEVDKVTHLSNAHQIRASLLELER